MDPALTHRLQRRLDEWQRFAPCLGVNVAIRDGRHGAWSGAAGWRDIGSGAPMPVDAVFYIYSLTKTFVAARLLQCDLDPDRPARDHLRDIAPPDGVTVRRLLNHTAGVPSYTDWPDYPPAARADPGRPWTAEAVIRRALAAPPDFPPGEGWRYSNTGYLLVARVLETIAGAPLAAAIGGGLAAPLRLDRTRVAGDVETEGRITPGYTRQLSLDERMVDAVPIYHPGWCLTGLMASTAMEAARFLEALMGGRVLGPARLAEMTTPVPIGGEAGPFFRKPCYGLGLMIDPEWGHGGLFGHGGDGPGANTWMMHLPDFHGRTLTLAAFCNTTMGGHPFHLAKDLLRVLATT